MQQERLEKQTALEAIKWEELPASLPPTRCKERRLSHSPTKKTKPHRPFFHRHQSSQLPSISKASSTASKPETKQENQETSGDVSAETAESSSPQTSARKKKTTAAVAVASCEAESTSALRSPGFGLMAANACRKLHRYPRKMVSWVIHKTVHPVH